MTVVCGCSIQMVFILLYAFRNIKGKCHRRLRLCSKKNYERNKYASSTVCNCILMLVDKVKALLKLKLLDDVQPCWENLDNRFLSLTNIHKGIMLDKLSKCIYVHSNYFIIHSSVVFLCSVLQLVYAYCFAKMLTYLIICVCRKVCGCSS